jgi:hypothetical protein
VLGTVLTTAVAPLNGSTLNTSLVSSLVAGVSDLPVAGQASPVKGIAITSINSGSLYFSRDNGSNWLQVSGVSSSNALLLLADSSTRLAYVPSAGAQAGSVNAFSFKAWDTTTGSAGSYVNPGPFAADGAFSQGSDIAAVTLVSGSVSIFTENGPAVDPFGLFSGNIFDNQNTPLLIVVEDVALGDTLAIGSGVATSIQIDLNLGSAPSQIFAGTYSVSVSGSKTTIEILGVDQQDKLLIANGITFLNNRDDLASGSRAVNLLEKGSIKGLGLITVTGTNDAPVASDDSETTGENAILNSSVLAATDVDGTIASYTLATGVGSGNGTLTFNSNGSYSFDPGSDFDALAAGASRDVSFTY